VAVNRIDPETGRAIQPAGNWTYKALERAARKIETAQGWEVLKEGRYEVTPNGEVKEKPPEQRDEGERLSQTARDIEAHTAAKSAERIGKETVPPIVQASKSWEELHEKLAERGIAFERKGSGAILKIGDTAIKASAISREMSLSKLETRLGSYRAAREAVSEGHPSIEPPEPIEKVEKEPKVKSAWERYQEAKAEYYDAKKRALADLQERQEKEKSELQKEQKEERTRLFAKSWKGRGGELNRRRSLMAAAQQAAKLDLRDRRKREQEWLKKQFLYSPLHDRFPNFKTWLNQEENPELTALFRYTDIPVMLEALPGAVMENIVGINFRDLRDFVAAAVPGNKSEVAYILKGRRTATRGAKAEFLDCGKRILLSKKCNQTTVLAVLQLASQKWGTIQLSGTEEYKQLCVKLAARYNFKIANAELQSAIEEERKRIADADEKRRAKAIGDGERAELFTRYADAVGAERFRIVVTDFLHLNSQGGTQAFVFDKKTDGLEGKTHEGILESGSLIKFRQYEHYGKNINVVPLSPDKHHILIDDMSAESLERLKEDGYRPACVIESSPGNFQAILTIPKLEGDPYRDREAANSLTKDLNKCYGDPKLSGAIHAHRLPPFANQKPKHRREDGTYPATRLAEAEGGLCEKAAAQLKETRTRLTGEAEKLRREQEHRARSAAFAKDWSAGATDPGGAYRAQWKDVIEKLRGDPDCSRVDAMAGIRMRVTGYSAGQIYEAIRENAPAMRKEVMSEREYSEKYRHRNWERYAKETVEKYVFGPRGAARYIEGEAYRAYYMKLEGRSMAEEMRNDRQKNNLSR
jgi:hypothetical protein